ncbi:transglycosylase SLT domain-containing protein [Nocardioides daphniae]|uniref:Lytic transglycosylase n=1 Tax=Nocardioides daphniae TaxID=402297 RepID=A0A4P7UFH7_9ACTN|nr:transglycosylase SLT domain-containing protein [Nocardioides daphniae]QCC78165.1 lytic transglycosylase [Nocardioides daphniae]GGD21363.1 hypothetical protein GCM10007231_20670 [Nocardioides daphniae]
MSVADVTSRISEIQGQLSLLAPTPSLSTGQAAFSAALEGALLDAGTTGGTGASGGSAEGQAVVDEAKKYLGIPYVWGGTDPSKGLDCSGLVQLVYRNLGYELPRVSYQQAAAGRPVASMAQAQPGDLLAWDNSSRNKGVDHIAIYIGNGKMIEAPRTGLDVRIIDVPTTPDVIRRIVPDGVAGTQATALPTLPGLPADGAAFAQLFTNAGAAHGVSPALLAAVARQESGFDPNAVSSAGAQGLMQLMPATAQGLGVTNSFDPGQAVDGAARLLRDLLDRFGSTDLALAAYNAGPGAVMRHGGIPPYQETQNYVRSIMAMLEGAR